MHKAIPPILAVTILSLGVVAALAFDWNANLGRAPDAAEVDPAAANRTAGEVAVAALRAHLRGQGGDRLTAIETHALAEPGAFAVCARMGSPTGPDVVARVIPALGILPGANGRQLEQDLARMSRSMVVLEDAPGLWRGGALGLPRQRYCGPVERPTPQAIETLAAQTLAAQTLAAQTLANETLAAPAAEPTFRTQLDDAVPASARSAASDGSVTVASPVRVRSGPSGQSEILWVAERGWAFNVHGHAPGGWVQIGDETGPAGWVHSSLLDPAM